MRIPLNIEPTFIEASDGSWLAVAGPDSAVRLGAMEQTKEQASDSFQAVLLLTQDALERRD